MASAPLLADAAFDAPSPLTLAWSELTVTVPASASPQWPVAAVLRRLSGGGSGGGDYAAGAVASARREVLSRASGSLRAGELVAVLGASGSGKTTLLTALARAASSGSRGGGASGSGLGAGAALAAGGSVTLSAPAAVALVAQEDLFMAHLTVAEHLRFHARLRLPALSRAAAEARADALLAEMGLVRCAGALIGAGATGGAAARGISGGERKRLSVATALLAEPKLIFADEPTSGLDSFTAEAVVRRLRALADDGRAVLCTIHQPSSHVLALFDRVVLLSDGATAFDGPVEAAIAHFAALGHPCPPRVNPADHLIRLLAPAAHEAEGALGEGTHDSGKYGSVSGSGGGGLAGGGSGAARARALALAWSETKGCAAAANFLPAAGVGLGGADGKPLAPPPPPPQRAGFLLQLAVLCERNARSLSRDPVLFYTRVVQTAVVSLLAGAVFFKLGFEQKTVMNRTGAIFFVLVNQSLAAIIGVLQTFPVERAVVQREQAAGAYGIPAYFLAKSVSSLPFELVFPAAFSTVCFWMMNLRGGAGSGEVSTWLQFAAVSVLTSNVATSMGLWISTAAPTVGVALALAPVVLMPFMLFSGFLVNVESVAPAFDPLLYTSLFKYGFSALMRIVWAGAVNSCAGEFICPFPDGEAVLRWFALQDSSVLADVQALAALAVGWRLLAFATLLWRARAD